MSTIISQLGSSDQRKNYRDRIVSSIYRQAETIAGNVVSQNNSQSIDWDRKIDDILTSRIWGYPIMLLLLGMIFWITISGANYPSEAIAYILFSIETKLLNFFITINVPQWIREILIFGLYRTVAWVVAVMLPPMAIFFPLFTLLENLGYLPRVAFNLDYLFKKCGTHGKQALTMCMGFGCNAAGVTSCRIIDSPRERIIATITNNFVPCNGRFPTLIILASIFMVGSAAGPLGGIISAFTVAGLVIIGIAVTLLVSYILSKTLLKGVPSKFTLELPPYRPPQVGRVIVNSILDRTLFVLARALVVAAPAGLVVWLMANISIGDATLLSSAANFLDPFAKNIGLDGFILMAFILGLAANEIVVPILIMAYLSTGAMLELNSFQEMKNLLVDYGWTWLTALNMMLFSLLHYPCSTTLITIFKETKSIKWTFLSFLIPTLVAISITFVTAQIAYFMNWV